MKTKSTLLSIAIIAALPFTANATQTIVETNTPAAVGQNGTVKKAAANAPYQTATIGEHDDEHIATTAYVKGAYNDAIAAVNKTAYLLSGDIDGKQNKLVGTGDGGDIYPDVFDYGTYALEAENVVSSGEADNLLVSVDALHGAIEAAKDEVQEELGDYQQKLVLDSDNTENVSQTVLDNGLGFMDDLSVLYDSSVPQNIKASTLANLQGQLITADAIATAMAETRRYMKQLDIQAPLNTTVNNIDRYINTTVAQTVNTTTPSATTLVSEAAIASEITALNNKRVEIYTTWGNDSAKDQVAFVTASTNQSQN